MVGGRQGEAVAVARRWVARARRMGKSEREEELEEDEEEEMGPCLVTRSAGRSKAELVRATTCWAHPRPTRTSAQQAEPPPLVLLLLAAPDLATSSSATARQSVSACEASFLLLSDRFARSGLSKVECAISAAVVSLGPDLSTPSPGSAGLELTFLFGRTGTTPTMEVSEYADALPLLEQAMADLAKGQLVRDDRCSMMDLMSAIEVRPPTSLLLERSASTRR